LSVLRTKRVTQGRQHTYIKASGSEPSLASIRGNMTGGRIVSEDNNNNNDAAPRKGRGWHGDSEGHARAGRKGGTRVAQDRNHMSDIGRRGGTRVAENREHMADIGRRGGLKVSKDREHMAEIGRRGGESR